jgi:predicted transcriptional regulator
MSKTLYVRVSTREDSLDRFEAAWHLASGRAAPAPLAILSFADLPLLAKNLTPARWALLQELKKNVHTDVARLLDLKLLEKNQDGQVSVPWQAVRAELRL